MEKMLIYWLKMRRQKSARSHTSVAVTPQIRQQGSRDCSIIPPRTNEEHKNDYVNNGWDDWFESTIIVIPVKS